MKKTTQKNTPDVEFWINKFKDLKIQDDHLKPQLKEAKENVIAHVKDHQLCTDDKKTCRFDNGTTVTRSSKVSTHIDQDLIDLAWLERFLSTPSADAISITIDHKKLKKTDADTASLLEEAGYEEVVTLSYTVNLSSAENA